MRPSKFRLRLLGAPNDVGRCDILGRPKNERPFLIVVAGYPAAEVSVPDISRKSLDAISSWWRENN